MVISKEIKKRLIIGLTTSFIVALLFAYRHLLKFSLLRAITPKTGNPENDKKIAKLHPVFAYKVARFINEVEQKIGPVLITSGFRTLEEQNELFTNKLTPAAPGRSFHNYGLAIDINVAAPDNLLQMEDSYSDWSEVDKISDNYKLRWVGDFATNQHDPVHFDYGNFITIDQAQTKLNNRDLAKGFIKI